MLISEIKIGSKAWTRVSGEKVLVIIMGITEDYYSHRRKVRVARADNGKRLDKARDPGALHPTPHFGDRS
jgi:hypothetical protein